MWTDTANSPLSSLPLWLASIPKVGVPHVAVRPEAGHREIGRVDAVAAVELVERPVGDEGIVADPAIEHVGAAATLEDVVAGGSLELVVAGIADQGVVVAR